MGVKDRISIIVKELGISGREFSQRCGFSESYFSSITDGIGADKLNRIISTFPQFSASWILTGKGEMLNKNETGMSLSDGFVEKNSRALEKLNESILSVLLQNGDVIKINREIVRQNAELIRQHAESMKVIQKLAERLL